MKILAIHFGGTVACAEQNGRLSPVADIRNYFKQISTEMKEASFTHKKCKCFLSEHSDGTLLDYVVEKVKKEAESGNFDGIIVTHGSDTIAYTAAALGYALGNGCVPTVVVCADFPLSYENSSGHTALRAATALILSGEAHGVFSVRVNEKNDATIFRATRSIRQKAYESELCGAGEPYGKVTLNAPSTPIFVKNRLFTEYDDELSPFNVKLKRLCPVTVINAYPSAVYQAPNGGCKAVIISTYHSGTLDTKSKSLLRFAEICKRRQIPIFADTNTGGIEYESEEAFSKLGIRRFPPFTSPEAMLVKLWYILSGDGDLNALSLSCGGDTARRNNDTGCVQNG